MVVQVMLTFWAATLAASDVRRRKLPNVWLLAGLALGVVVLVGRGVLPFGHALLEGVLALALALACFVPFYLAGWMGAGDVKFLAVIGWLGGFEILASVFVIGSLIAGVAAVAIRGYPRAWRRLAGGYWLSDRLAMRVPYGACLALAFVAVVWLGHPEWLPAIKGRFA
jgi:prepilin peptidase CpaA